MPREFLRRRFGRNKVLAKSKVGMIDGPSGWFMLRFAVEAEGNLVWLQMIILTLSGFLGQMLG